MGKSVAILEKIALKIPNIKIRNFTSNELKLWDIEHFVKPIEELEKTIPSKHMNKHIKKFLSFAKNRAANLNTREIMGTIRKDPKTKKSFVILNTDLTKNLPRRGRRMVIAHEAYHAKLPGILGLSELGAHIYGGIKSKAGVFSKYGPVDMYKHFLKTRPKTALIEHGILGSGVYGISKLKKSE